MTGWEIVGLFLVFLPALCLVIMIAVDDFFDFVVTLGLLVLILVPIVVGSLLVTGDWTP